MPFKEQGLEAFCGIDVACAKNKALPMSVVMRTSGGLRALPLRSSGIQPPRGMGNRLALDPNTRTAFAVATLKYLRQVEKQFGVVIAEVAIDAPRAPSLGSRRLCEQAMDRLGLSCIATPSNQSFEGINAKVSKHLAAGGAESSLPHANQIWMLVGFELFRVLGEKYRCIEVFPNAIVNVIAPGSSHKSRAEGFASQLAGFVATSGWDARELPQVAHGARHDRLDALMGAWIASLPETEREAHGDGVLDTIWTPRQRTSFHESK